MVESTTKPHRIVLTTCGSTNQAADLAMELVSRRLAACVSVVEGVRSFYWWEGRVQEAGEVLLTMKTRVELLPKLEAAIRELHTYDVPEFVVLPVTGGSEAYLNWLDNNVAKVEA